MIDSNMLFLLKKDKRNYQNEKQVMNRVNINNFVFLKKLYMIHIII